MNTNKTKNPSLKDLQKEIARQIDMLEVNEYAHSIISLTLSWIEELYGIETLNETKQMYILEELGWE